MNSLQPGSGQTALSFSGISDADQKFLKEYDVSQFERPSVTVDILIFTADLSGSLELLLIKRNIPPFEGCWALPGGFIRMDESLDDAAKRKLKEETGVEGISIEQLYTFGNVNRDPRTRVISVAYFALIPKNKLQISAGTGASQAGWFQVHLAPGEAIDHICIGDNLPLAFDHKDIIAAALERLRGKISYTPIACNLLKDSSRFAIYELQKIYEAILEQKMDTPNFRRMFLNTYVAKGLAEATGEECYEYSKRASQYYRLLSPQQ